MLLIVTGGFRAATMYMWSICKEILKQNNLFTTFGDSYPLDHGWKYRVEGNDICETIHDSHKGRDYCRLLIIKQSPHPHFSSFAHLHLPATDIVDKASLFMTHKPIDYYERMDVGQSVDCYIFCHRNPLDEAASVIKAQTTIDFSSTDPVRNYDNNPANYHILAQDLKESFLYLDSTGGLREIRKGCLCYLQQHQNNPRVHGFRFGDFSPEKERKKIKHIAEILGCQVDAEAIQQTITHGKKKGRFHFTSNTKFNTSTTFFKESLHRRLELYFQDTMALMDYCSRDDFDIPEGAVTVVAADEINEDDLDDTIKAMEQLGITVNETTIISSDGWQHFEFNSQSTFVLCIPHKRSFGRVKKNPTYGPHCMLHPHYQAMVCFDETLFDLSQRKSAALTSLHGEKIRILVDWRSVQNGQTLNNVLHTLAEQFSRLEVQLCIPHSDNACDIGFFSQHPSCRIVLMGDWNHGSRVASMLQQTYPTLEIAGFINSFAEQEKVLEGIHGMQVDALATLEYDWLVLCADQRNLHQLKHQLTHVPSHKIRTFNQAANTLREHTPFCSTVISDVDSDVLLYSLQPRVLRAMAKRMAKRMGSHTLYSCLPQYAYAEKTLYEQARHDSRLQDDLH